MSGCSRINLTSSTALIHGTSIAVTELDMNNLAGSIGKKRLLLIAVILSLAVFAKFWLFGSYLTSSLLIEDDTIFIGHYYFGVPMKSPITQDLYYSIAEAFTSVGGIFAAKLLLLLVQIAIALFACLVINQFARAPILSLALAIALMSYPVALDQNYFIIGAHPQFGVLTLFAGIYCLLKGPFSESSFFTLKSLAAVLLAAACFIASARSSPTFILMPAILMATITIMVLGDGFRSKFDHRHIWAGIVLSANSSFLVLGGFDYHYSATIGWMDPSVDQITQNLFIALSFVLHAPVQDKTWFQIIIGLGVFLCLVLACFALQQRMKSGSRENAVMGRVLFLGFLVVCAAFLFGPGSITTKYLSRYVIAPYSVMALMLGCLIGWSYQSISSQFGILYRAAILSSFGLVAVCTIWVAGNDTRAVITPYQDSHAIIIAALEPYEFGPEDQIVVLLPENATASTGGYNHWSTWYLRVLTKNPKVIGLVGKQTMFDPKKGAVFVDEYKDHDAIYWTVIDGRSYRTQMMGLETDRRLFTFVPDSDGGLIPGDAMAADQDGIARRIKFGDQVLQSNLQQTVVDEVCKPAQQPTGNLAWFLADRSEDIGTSIQKTFAQVSGGSRLQFIETVFQSNSTHSKAFNVNVDRGELVRIELTIRPQDIDAGEASYSDTYPPMPLLSPAIAIYHVGRGFQILTREEPSQSYNVSLLAGEDMNLEIIGCEGGQAAIFFGSEMIGTISRFTPSGDWVLGKGFLNRSWDGEFSSFTVSRFNAPTGE